MNNQSGADKYIEFLCNLAPMLQKLIPVDCIIGIADTEKSVCSLPGENISLPGNIVGTSLLDMAETPVAKAIIEKKPQKFITPKEVLGIAFQAMAIPVFDMEGNVIAGIGIGVGLDNKDILATKADQVAKSSDYVKHNVQELYKSAEQLSSKQENLLELTNDITDQINKTQKIIEIINRIAHTSKILGINASIESARAGQEGLGFSVVATEVQKMAEDSSKAVIEVENILKEIKEKIIQIDNEVNATTEIGSMQATATKDLSNLVIELSGTAKILQEAAKEVIG